MDYVLIHGGATTGAFWDLVAPLLDGQVLAVDLPGRRTRPADLATLRVEDAAASVVRDIEDSTLGHDLVLVAHSSGGLEIPAVVASIGVDRIRSIVLNAASVPPEGGNGIDCMQTRHRELSLRALEHANAAGIAMTTPVPDVEAMRTSSGEELNDEQHAFVTDPTRCVADSFNLYRGPVHWSMTAGIPVTYIINQRDRAVPPALQEEMAARLPGPVRLEHLDTGHLPAVSQPAELAELIMAAARRLSDAT